MSEGRGRRGIRVSGGGGGKEGGQSKAVMREEGIIIAGKQHETGTREPSVKHAHSRK
jgi:hypothetical protein